jgi:hypothetical protein
MINHQLVTIYADNGDNRFPFLLTKTDGTPIEALDEVFELSSKERRRFVVYYLEQQDGPVPSPS